MWTFEDSLFCESCVTWKHRNCIAIPESGFAQLIDQAVFDITCICIRNCLMDKEFVQGTNWESWPGFCHRGFLRCPSNISLMDFARASGHTNDHD